MDAKEVIAGIADQFIEMARSHYWPEVSHLSIQEENVLTEILTVAGFDFREIVAGAVPDKHFCPYLVVGLDGRVHVLATGWLSKLLQDVCEHLEKDEDEEFIVIFIQRVIEQATPLHPIPFTPEGDQLTEIERVFDPIVRTYYVEHARDSNALKTGCVGVHRYCGGNFDRHRQSLDHDVLACCKCFLRVRFPSSTATYGELRSFFASRTRS